ncbi:member of ShlA/HecA/FhaA exoprotein [Escherichia coli TA464]|uniref:hypothetical protein n=1 Tax=Escherichia coli TaxID=562 RepID=UPI000A1854C0|nr:hypothetical protein [Escherichia coli]OSL40998.1 member of ShlA/HecA/FhaA exoprotein [Escherichia coli TA464]
MPRCLSVVQKNSAFVGSATGELAARAIGMLYPGVKLSDLSEEQKQSKHPVNSY